MQDEEIHDSVQYLCKSNLMFEQKQAHMSEQWYLK